MSSYKIGVNLRVTENSNQGGRKYMEDNHSIRFVKNEEGGFEFAYFGIFDGHGGAEASKFARDHLLEEITKYDSFWSENDDDVLFAIKSGFIDTHFAMWKEVEKWPRTFSGYPSTSGTTGSIGIIKNSKLYIGHVGDSGIALGLDESKCDKFMRLKGSMLTVDHKPDTPEEKRRIEGCGGQVVAKSGVQRVVWNRPKVTHKGPIRRSTPIDKIPFLAVARSLGDLWSYNYLNEEFVVSPSPDVCVRQLDPDKDKCLVFGSDGLWNMMSAEEAVSMVMDLEYHFQQKVINDPNVTVSYWLNPAEKLVQKALNKWRAKLMRADNTSCIVVLIDPLGPRKLSILRKLREENLKKQSETSKMKDEPKHATRSSPRKSHESVKKENENAEVKSHPPKSESVVSSAAHNATARRKTMNDVDLGMGLMASQVVSPVCGEKRHSLPGNQDADLDDSIQATSAHRKISQTPNSELLSNLSNTGISKNMSHKRTRHQSGSAVMSNLALSNRISRQHNTLISEPCKKETFTASALKDLSILTDSLRPSSYRVSSADRIKHPTTSAACSFKDVQNIVCHNRMRSRSGDVHSVALEKRTADKDIKKNLKYEKFDAPSQNLRKPHILAHSDIKKGLNLSSKLRNKAKRRSLRCRGQLENKMIMSKKSAALKRKRESTLGMEGVPVTKKACRR